ncbi:hypothetical protein H8B09_01925 [Paenibacillus sp. PR3]|uniref:Uncharacterized protein n=1 Tax=Paenibacillus terricola TaxID=2763503 RepID=A0ABR8MRF7_9BACL|nr:hypothetical protein [Paenibacillus terricola]MBD3917497.1 hypothetical protein [Paenibacillus terricola]
MLTYAFNPDIIYITESNNDGDVEFFIRFVVEAPHLEKFKEVQHYFEDNEVYTDALFYAYENHEYRVIVRSDYYVEFVLQLMKHRLVEQVQWKE